MTATNSQHYPGRHDDDRMVYMAQGDDGAPVPDPVSGMWAVLPYTCSPPCHANTLVRILRAVGNGLVLVRHLGERRVELMDIEALRELRFGFARPMRGMNWPGGSKPWTTYEKRANHISVNWPFLVPMRLGCNPCAAANTLSGRQSASCEGDSQAGHLFQDDYE